MTPERPAFGHAVWWGLFAAGGMVAAVLLPVHILFQGILGPLGLAPYLDGNFSAFSRMVGNPLGKLYVLVLVGLTLVHTAHRFHFWLHHLGVHVARRPISYASYSAAVLLALATAYVLFTSP